MPENGPVPTLPTPVASEPAPVVSPDVNSLDATDVSTALAVGVPANMVGSAKQVADQQKQHTWADMAAVSPTVADLDKLIHSHVYDRVKELHSVQLGLQDYAKYYTAIHQDKTVPEYVGNGIFAIARGTGHMLKQTGVSALMVPALAVDTLTTGARALRGEGPTALEDSQVSKVADLFVDNQEAHRLAVERRNDEYMAEGGGRFGTVVLSLLEDAPSIVRDLPGFGALGRGVSAVMTDTASTVKAAGVVADKIDSPSMTIRQVLRTAAKEGQVTLTKAQEIRLAITANAIVQGSIQAGQSLVEKGRDGSISSSDVAYAVSTAGVVGLTEFLGGMSGEARMILSSFEKSSVRSAWTEAGRDLLVQSSQGALQGGSQSILDDLTAGRQVNWDEYRWNTFAGAIGNGAFSFPAIAHAIKTTMSPAKATLATKQLEIIQHDLAAAKVVANATTIATSSHKLEQINLNALSTDQARDLVQKISGVNIVQHITPEDFAKLAEIAGYTPDVLFRKIGAKEEAGILSIPVENVVVFGYQSKPEVLTHLIDVCKSDPDMPSLKEYHERYQTLSDEMQDLIDKGPMLPDGTIDDSDDLAEALFASYRDESGKVGAKITDGQAKMAARTEATLWRSSAIMWNEAAVKSGSSERVTPMRLHEKNKAYLTSAKATSKDQTGAYNPVTKTLTLTENSNITTILHENMHHWFEVNRAWASQEDAPQVIKDNIDGIREWAKFNAENIVAHHNKLYPKTPVTIDEVFNAAEDLTKLDLSSRAGVAIHEGLTGAAEQYFASGKAPTSALKRVFDSFQKWFRKIYDTIYNTTGTNLLDDRARQVFDTWFKANDDVAPNYLEGMTPESMGMTPEAFKLFEDDMSSVIAKAREEGIARIRKDTEERLAAEHAEDMAEIKAKVEVGLKTIPIRRLQVNLAGRPLNKDQAMAVLKTAGANPDVAQRLVTRKLIAEAGESIEEMALNSGYDLDDAVKMLNDLVNTNSFDEEVARQVAMHERPVDVQRELEAEIESGTGRLIIANAIYAAVDKHSKPIKAEARAAAREAAKAEKQYNDLKTKMAEKVKALSDKIKTQKDIDKTTAESFRNELSSDVKDMARDSAEYRLMQMIEDGLSREQILHRTYQGIESANKESLRRASKNEWKEAFDAHVEHEVLLAMRKQAEALSGAKDEAFAKKLANRDKKYEEMKSRMQSRLEEARGKLKTKAQVDKLASQQIRDAIAKDTAYAKMIDEGAKYRFQELRDMGYTRKEIIAQATAKKDAAHRDSIKDLSKKNLNDSFDAHMEYLIYERVAREARHAKADKTPVSMSEYEVSIVSQIAKSKFAGVPLHRLNPDRYTRIANGLARQLIQARKDLNSQLIVKLTHKIAIAEAMHLEALALRNEQRAIERQFSKTLTSEMHTLAMSSGRPAIFEVKTGRVLTFDSRSAMQDALVKMDNREYYEDVSTELADVHEMLSRLVQDGGMPMHERKTLFNKMLSNYPYLITRNMVELAQEQKLHPITWTIDDYNTVKNQLDHILYNIKSADSIRKQVEADRGKMKAGVPTDRTAPPPSRSRGEVRRLFGRLIDCQWNLRTLLHPLGDDAKRVILDAANEADLSYNALRERVHGITDEAIKAFTPDEISAMKTQVDVGGGVKMSREEQVVQIAMLGSSTGRDRVVNSMTTHYIMDGKMDGATARATANEYVVKLVEGLTDKEVNLVKAIWKSYDEVWKKQVTAARSAGVPVPKPIDARTFTVKVGDKTEELFGGYAAVPYDKVDIDLALFDDKGNISTTAIADGMLKSRRESVVGKRLICDLDTQFSYRNTNMRTACYLNYVQRLAPILNDQELRDLFRKHMGEDWTNDLHERIRFAVNGVQTNTTIEKAAHFARTSTLNAVFVANLTTAAKQLAGAYTSIGHKGVDTRGVCAASAQFLKNPRETMNFIMSKDNAMRERLLNQDVDLGNGAGPMTMRRDLSSKLEHTNRTIAKYGTIPMRYCQFYTDCIAWMSAYNNSLKKNEHLPESAREAQAIRDARDCVIETQGTTMRAEQAEISHTHMGMLFTFAGKWCINNSNTLRRMAMDISANDPGAKVRFTKYAMASIVVGSIVGSSISALLRPEQENQEPGDYINRTVLSMLSSPHFMLQTSVPAMQKMWEHDITGGVATAVGGAGSFARNALAMPVALGDLSRGKGGAYETLKAATNTAGALGLPSNAINKINDALFGEWDENSERVFIALFGKDAPRPGR